MEFKTTGGVKLPVLGLGTWGMGGRMEKDDSQDDKCIKVIKTAINIGYTHIDTAEVYGNGHAEELVGEGIKCADRENLFLTTKVKRSNLAYDDVVKAVKRSLSRLQMDYIDLYLIHAPNTEIPISETMKAIDFLVSENLVRYIGVSNFSVKQMKESQDCTQNKIITNQIEYNLVTRNKGQFLSNMESEVVPYCQENDMFITAYRPLIKGMLPIHELLDGLCKKYDKTRAQILINWLISKKNVITIPKTANIQHLQENMGGIGWKLDRADIKTLDEINPQS